MTTLTTEAYEFVGGPYDGRRMPLDGPPADVGTELLVHQPSGSGRTPEFYVLGDDLKFHYSPAPEPPFARRGKPTPA